MKRPESWPAKSEQWLISPSVQFPKVANEMSKKLPKWDMKAKALSHYHSMASSIGRLGGGVKSANALGTRLGEGNDDTCPHPLSWNAKMLQEGPPTASRTGRWLVRAMSDCHLGRDAPMKVCT